MKASVKSRFKPRKAETDSLNEGVREDDWTTVLRLTVWESGSKTPWNKWEPKIRECIWSTLFLYVQHFYWDTWTRTTFSQSVIQICTTNLWSFRCLNLKHQHVIWHVIQVGFLSHNNKKKRKCSQLNLIGSMLDLWSFELHRHCYGCINNALKVLTCCMHPVCHLSF